MIIDPWIPGIGWRQTSETNTKMKERRPIDVFWSVKWMSYMYGDEWKEKKEDKG